MRAGVQRLADQRTPATAASGPKRHEITLILEPGIYTYADNVHPYVMRGTLRVLP